MNQFDDNQANFPEPPNFKNLKNFYYDFLHDFRDYLAEYVRENVVELCISEIAIGKPVKIFDGYTQGKAIIKNQGTVSCYLSTNGMGGYKLDPGEKIEFFVNQQVIATTVSGTATLGFIKT